MRKISNPGGMVTALVSNIATYRGITYEQSNLSDEQAGVIDSSPSNVPEKTNHINRQINTRPSNRGYTPATPEHFFDKSQVSIRKTVR
jgi:hypothetical protein